jgi:DNA repair photolyase
VNAPEVLRRELPTIGDAAIKICPVISDPYHALEAREELTRRCLAVLAEGPARDVLVLTRSALVERDLPLLAELGAHLGVSLPTLDDDVRRHFEPRAASIAERLNVLREARAVGVRTFAVVQPLLPGPIDALADALAATVGSVRVDVLHGVEAAARDFEGAHAVAREDAWQAERAAALVAALEARGVPRWSSELPPTG